MPDELDDDGYPFFEKKDSPQDLLGRPFCCISIPVSHTLFAVDYYRSFLPSGRQGDDQVLHGHQNNISSLQAQ